MLWGGLREPSAEEKLVWGSIGLLGRDLGQGVAHFGEGLIAFLDEALNGLEEDLRTFFGGYLIEVCTKVLSFFGGSGEPELGEVVVVFLWEELGELLHFGTQLWGHLGDLAKADAHGFALGFGHILDKLNGLAEPLEFFGIEGEEFIELFQLAGQLGRVGKVPGRSEGGALAQILGQLWGLGKILG